MLTKSKETETQVVQLKGHTKKVNMKEDATIPGCNDNTVSLWNVMSGNCRHVLRVHDGPVTGINTGKLVSNVTTTDPSHMHLGL